MNVTTGSGNIFEDLGFDDAPEMLAKSRLASKINELIREKGLRQQAAADLLGIKQPKLSNLLRGDFRGISQLMMFELLRKLGNDVKVVVEPKPRTHKAGQYSIVFAEGAMVIADGPIRRRAKKAGSTTRD
ncbi:MAG TPA: helix-turn-helix transcriptional regulator [bacterium]|jgi:predicted XRE-type DNA-binding protein|nr:helix-turn-helix transcriptional regulator [bacterium]